MTSIKITIIIRGYFKIVIRDINFVILITCASKGGTNHRLFMDTNCYFSLYPSLINYSWNQFLNPRLLHTHQILTIPFYVDKTFFGNPYLHPQILTW
jgi:hypothetical protein